MKEMYEALQGIQHYTKKAMQAMQQMASMGQRGGQDNFSVGSPMGQRNGMENDNAFGQRNDNGMPFNPMMFM